jgi:transposase
MLSKHRGVLTKKIHALTDGECLLVKFVITPCKTHDIQVAARLLADKAYDADWVV